VYFFALNSCVGLLKFLGCFLGAEPLEEDGAEPLKEDVGDVCSLVITHDLSNAFAVEVVLESFTYLFGVVAVAVEHLFHNLIVFYRVWRCFTSGFGVLFLI
jgi:hypothetical protein